MKNRGLGRVAVSLLYQMLCYKIGCSCSVREDGSHEHGSNASRQIAVGCMCPALSFPVFFRLGGHCSLLLFLSSISGDGRVLTDPIVCFLKKYRSVLSPRRVVGAMRLNNLGGTPLDHCSY